MRNWRKDGKCLILFFGTAHGEVKVLIPWPGDKPKKEDVLREAEKIRETYHSRAGVSLGKYHHARLITFIDDAIPGIPKPPKRR